MNNQRKFFQIVGKISSGTEFKLQFAAAILLQPSRNFHFADIVGQGMMRARFGNQHPVARPQAVNGGGAPA